MNPIGILFGLGAALSWGGGDFAAGSASRRVPPIVTMALSQGIGLAIAILVLAVAAEPSPAAASLAWAVVGGASGVVCLLTLYRGLSTHPMGLFSSIATMVGVVIPVAVGAAFGDRLRTQDIAGIGLAIAAIALVTRPTGDMRIDPSGLGLAVLSGLGGAGYFLAMGQATAAGGTTWWLVVAGRSTSLALAILIIAWQGRTRSAVRSLSPLIAFAGAADLAGNAFFLLATAEGALSLAVVVSSQFPAVTSILAAALLAQRPGRIQTLGILVALSGIGLMSVR